MVLSYVGFKVATNLADPNTQVRFSHTTFHVISMVLSYVGGFSPHAVLRYLSFTPFLFQVEIDMLMGGEAVNKAKLSDELDKVLVKVPLRTVVLGVFFYREHLTSNYVIQQTLSLFMGGYYLVHRPCMGGTHCEMFWTPTCSFII